MMNDEIFRLGRWVWAGVVVLSVCGMARGEDAIHLGLPQDTLAFVELDPGAGPAEGEEKIGLVDLGLGVMRTTGVLSGEAKEVVDILGMASEAGGRHSCVALLDADLAVNAEKDLECRSVQVAWVVDTEGEPQEMVAKLTEVLGHFSDRATAKETIRKTAEEKREYVEFRDTKWPAWLCLDWVQVGNDFVLTVGDGAMAHYLADRPVGGAPWAQSVVDIDAAATKAGSVGSVLARVYVSVKGFRERFPAAMRETVLGKLFGSLDLAGSDAALFSARCEGRAIAMDDGTVDGAGVHVTPWTVALAADSPLLKLV